MERKTFAFKLTSLDFEGRTLEGYAAAFGNIDQVGDIVHPGAFTKTLAERGGKIKFLWQHKTEEPIGRVIEAREEATGLFVKAIISDTARGRDALALLKDGAINEMSIGYDTIKGGTDYSKSGDQTIRNLREVKLYEVSLVTFPANEMATVTALKDAEPSEGKPFPNEHAARVRDPGDFQEDSFRSKTVTEGVRIIMGRLKGEDTMTAQSYRFDADKITPEEARKWLKDNDVDYSGFEEATGEEKDAKEWSPVGPIRRLGDMLQGSLHRMFTLMCDDWYTQGFMNREERILCSSAIGDALDALTAKIPEEIANRPLDHRMEGMGMPAYMMGLTIQGEIKSGRRMRAEMVGMVKEMEAMLSRLRKWADYEDDEEEETEEETPAPDKAADNEHEQKQAGPAEPPTSKHDELMRKIEIEQEQLRLYLEV